VYAAAVIKAVLAKKKETHQGRGGRAVDVPEPEPPVFVPDSENLKGRVKREPQEPTSARHGKKHTSNKQTNKLMHKINIYSSHPFNTTKTKIEYKTQKHSAKKMKA